MTRIHLLINFLKKVLGYTSKEWDRLGEENSTLVNELLKIFVEKPELSDEHAAHLLMRSDIKDPNYRRVNSKLGDSLFEEVLRFTPSPSRFTRYQINYYQDQKLITVFRILKRLGQVELCQYLAKKLHKRSKLFHYTDIRLETSKYLLKYYFTIKVNLRKAEHFAKDNALALDILNLENNLEVRTYTTISHVLRNESNLKDELKNTLDYLDSIQEKIGIPSEKFHLFYYRLKMIIYEEQNEFEKALKTARLGLQYFENITFENDFSKMFFLRCLSDNYINLGYHTEAMQTIEKSVSLHKRKDMSWVNLKVTLIKLQCRNILLEEAYHNFIEIKKYKQYDSLPDNTKTHLTEFELLFFYLQLKGRLEVSSKLSLRNIRKIINSLYNLEMIENDYSKIIALLIAIHYKNKLVFSLSDQDVLKYTAKRLNKNSPFFKRNCLVRMLLMTIEKDYHPSAINRGAALLKSKLNSPDIDKSSRSLKNELVPYEFLWETVIDDFIDSDVKTQAQLQ